MLNAVNYEHVTYEGYGPSGIAIIVEALTDNKNRTASNVRNAFTKGNGSIGTPADVYPTCSTRRDRSSLTVKSAIWTLMS